MTKRKRKKSPPSFSSTLKRNKIYKLAKISTGPHSNTSQTFASRTVFATIAKTKGWAIATTVDKTDTCLKAPTA